jgi:hypothetical protein
MGNGLRMHRAEAKSEIRNQKSDPPSLKQFRRDKRKTEIRNPKFGGPFLVLRLLLAAPKHPSEGGRIGLPLATALAKASGVYRSLAANPVRVFRVFSGEKSYP